MLIVDKEYVFLYINIVVVIEVHSNIGFVTNVRTFRDVYCNFIHIYDIVILWNVT